MSHSSNAYPNADQVDVRGPRFAAWVTTAVLIATLLLAPVSTTAAAVVLGLQAVVFAIGAVRGPRAHPYGRIFATFVLPRVGPVQEREPVAPLRFAQLVGLVFAVVGTAGGVPGGGPASVVAAARSGPLVGCVAGDGGTASAPGSGRAGGRPVLSDDAHSGGRAIPQSLPADLETAGGGGAARGHRDPSTRGWSVTEPGSRDHSSTFRSARR